MIVEWEAAANSDSISSRLAIPFMRWQHLRYGSKNGKKDLYVYGRWPTL